MYFEHSTLWGRGCLGFRGLGDVGGKEDSKKSMQLDNCDADISFFLFQRLVPRLPLQLLNSLATHVQLLYWCVRGSWGVSMVTVSRNARRLLKRSTPQSLPEVLNIRTPVSILLSTLHSAPTCHCACQAPRL